MKIFIAIFLFLVVVGKSSNAQTNSNSETETICDSLHQAKPGTFELFRTEGTSEYNNWVPPILTVNDLCFIESNRHAIKDITLLLSPFTTVRIYSAASLTATK
jgi:hypothetical protein